MTNQKKKPATRKSRALALAKLGLAAAALYAAPTLMQLDQAQASSGGGFGGGSDAIQAAADPVAQKECGDCHMPYSPRYLPSGSWSTMINNLQDHFGEDASLDQQTTQSVGSYYTDTSNSGGRGTGALRITETRWFQGEHRGEASFGRVKAFQCEKCHSVMGMPGQQQNQGGWGGWFGR